MFVNPTASLGARIRLTQGPGVARVRTVSLLAALLWAGPSAAEAQVTVDGGPDAAGHEYSWTVTNGTDSAIVRIEIPHFRGDLCLPPDAERWEVTLTGVNAMEGKPGVCTLSAAAASAGIAPGASASLRLRVGPRGAPTGRGHMTVTLADGRRVSAEADLPVGGSRLDRFAPLIGLSVMFGLFVLYRAVRGRRATRPGVV